MTGGTFLWAVAAIFVERIAIILSAFVSIYFGWSLFRSKIVVGQDGVLSVGDWKVELKQVGPGIFFSLFGTSILVAAFLHPMQFDGNASGDTIPTIHASGLLPTSNADQMRFVRAINTVSQIRDTIKDTPQAEQTVTLARVQIEDLARAADRLDELRDQIVVAKFGSNALGKWRENRDAFRNNPGTLAPEIRKELTAIDPWMTNNISGERR